MGQAPLHWDFGPPLNTGRICCVAKVKLCKVRFSTTCVKWGSNRAWCDSVVRGVSALLWTSYVVRVHSNWK